MAARPGPRPESRSACRDPGNSRAQPLVLRPHRLPAVGALEPADGEVAAGHILEMIDEGVVHRRSAERAHDRQRLRGELLGDHHAEAGCDLRDEADQDRGAFLDDAAFGDEARGLGDRFRQHAAHHEIAALGGVSGGAARAERKHLHAGERGIRVGEVLALAARDIGDRAQHDDGRDRDLERRGNEAEAAADRARGGRQRLVQQARCGFRPVLHGAQRHLQGRVQALGGGGRDRVRGAFRQRRADQLDRLADDVGQPRRQARVLEQPHRGSKRLQVVVVHGLSVRVCLLCRMG